MKRLTRHQRRDRRARVRSAYLEGVRTGRIVTPEPAPLFTAIETDCFRNGLSRRDTRIVVQRALQWRLARGRR